MHHVKAMCRSRGGAGARGPDPRLKNHKGFGFLSNTSPDPLKNHKATKPAFNVGNGHWPASKTPLKWRFVAGLMIAHFKCYFDPISPHQLKKHCQSLIPSGKTFWISTSRLYIALVDGKQHVNIMSEI